MTDGYYFVRYRLGDDTRRFALRRSNGRFTKVGDFYRRATCDLVPSYKLIRPVFGGTADARARDLLPRGAGGRA